MRLIDADAFVKHVVFLCGGNATDPYYNGYADALDRIEEVLEQFPTVDAVPVIRCKNCRYRTTAFEENGYAVCWQHERYVTEDYYCASGAPVLNVGDSNG